MASRMRTNGRRVLGLLTGAAAILLALPAASATASGAPYTCNGGSIPGGDYSAIVVSGFCQINAGTVNVAGGLSIGNNAGLLAAFGGSDLHVGKNLTVGSGGTTGMRTRSLRVKVSSPL